MRKLTIYLSPFMNNWEIIPIGYELDKKYEIYFTEDVKYSLKGDKLKTNLDLAIHCNHHPSINLSDILSKDKTLKIERHTKDIQALKINQVVSSFTEAERSSFRSLVPLDNVTDFEGIVVAKPNAGARSLAMFRVNCKGHGLKRLVKLFQRRNKGDLESGELIKEIFKIDPTAKLNKGMEDSLDEWETVSRTQPYVFQEYISNVKAEYRALTDHNSSVVYVAKRRFKDMFETEQEGDFTGDKQVRLEDIFTKTQISAINKIVKEVVGPMSSVDLFTTTDDKWGIFEYSNQFGYLDVPKDFVFNLHKNALKALIKKAKL